MHRERRHQPSTKSARRWAVYVILRRRAILLSKASASMHTRGLETSRQVRQTQTRPLATLHHRPCHSIQHSLAPVPAPTAPCRTPALHLRSTCHHLLQRTTARTRYTPASRRVTFRHLCHSAAAGVPIRKRTILTNRSTMRGSFTCRYRTSALPPLTMLPAWSRCMGLRPDEHRCNTNHSMAPEHIGGRSSSRNRLNLTT